MFDIGWGELVVIGIVALIAIGPKELPGVLRTFGQTMAKIRRMAAEFQGQFQEALREAEMADLKKQVDDMASDIKSYDPLKDVRADVEALGKDLDESVKSPDKAADKDAAKESIKQAVNATDSAATAPTAEAFPSPQATAELRDKEVAGAGVGPVAPEAAAESTSSGGTGKPQ